MDRRDWRDWRDPRLWAGPQPTHPANPAYPALLLCTMLVLCTTGAAEAQSRWAPARPDYSWSFPADHWAHPEYATEWWYFTGHLTAVADPGRRFGYQFTFFRIGLTPEPPPLESAWATQSLIMGHLAITDLATGRHVFSELLYRTAPFLGGFGAPGDTLIGWSRAPPGTDADWTLRWTGTGFALAARDDARGIALELSAQPTKPLVFQGPNGYSRKGASPTAASLYYSFTRLVTEGTLGLDGERVAVRGESWMDKEVGSNQLSARQVGWDWLSLQLDDGRDVMLYVVRDASGVADFGLGTVVQADGRVEHLGAPDFTVTVTQTWRSPATNATYPAGWSVVVPAADLRVMVRPLLASQENVSALVPGLHYWEGAVAVRDGSDRPLGLGYVELTGYGTRRRPAI